MKVAIIPARGGSKRIPRKNIKEFRGRPMISWSISAAIESGLFDKIIVSTDDLEIQDVAIAAGAEAPFIRPSQLADDHTPTVPVVKHAVEWVEANIGKVEHACCIYATAPFLQACFIRKGLETLNSSSSDFSVSVTTFPAPIQRALSMSSSGLVAMADSRMVELRSQDLQEFYHDAGQFYWGLKSAWVSEKTIFGARASGVIIPMHLVQDIDTPEDWRRAEIMHQVAFGS